MKHAVTLLVDADEVEAINNHLERQGYGPGNVSVPVQRKGSKKDKPDGYMVDTIADDGLKASLEKMGRQSKKKRIIAEPLQVRQRKEREAEKQKKKSIREQRLDEWGVDEKREKDKKRKDEDETRQ